MREDMLHMGNEYMQYPATVKALAEELKVVCDDYYAKKINNDRVREVVLCYANSQSDKLFTDNDINPTVSKIIGKKRVRLISNLLNDDRARA